MLGSLFIAVTLFMPRGIVGTYRYWMAERRARLSAKSPDVTAATPRPAE
jgi:urea transport system permease protein